MFPCRPHQICTCHGAGLDTGGPLQGKIRKGTNIYYSARLVCRLDTFFVAKILCVSLDRAHKMCQIDD